MRESSSRLDGFRSRFKCCRNLTHQQAANSVPRDLFGESDSVASLFSPQLKRLLNYVRPYSFRLGRGILLLAFVALAEGGVALWSRRPWTAF